LIKITEMTRKTIFLLFVSFLVSIHIVLPQTPEWDWGMYANGNTIQPYGTVVDSYGNTIQAGHFFNTVNFMNDTLVSKGHFDIFIAKYDPNGSLLWVKSFGDTTMESCMTLDIDENDCFYIGGDFLIDTLSFGNISAVNNLSGNNNIYLAKFDSNGNALWVKSASGSGEALVGRIKYKDGFVYQIGSIKSDSVIICNNVLSCHYNSSLFIAKYDSLGNGIWAKQVTGLTLDTLNGSVGHAVAIDHNGNIIVVGATTLPLTYFDTLSIQVQPGMNSDYFIVSYDSSGNAQWVSKGSSAYFDTPWDVETDSDNNSYVVGSYAGNMYFNTDSLPSPGGPDIFMAKYNEYGDEVWIKSIGNNGHDLASSIEIDEVDNLFISGHFTASSFMIDSIQLIGDSIYYTAYVAKFNQNGDAIWAKSFYSPGIYSSCRSMKVSQGNVYLSGGNDGMNLINGPDSITLSPGNKNWTYLMKLGKCALNNATALFNDTVLCNNQTLQLNVNEGVQYLWNTGDTTSNLVLSQGGQYAVFIADSLGCIKYDSILIADFDPSNYLIDLGQDINLCTEQQFPINLTAGNNNFLSYNWNNGDIGSFTQITDTGIYIINAIYECGTVSDSITINLNPAPLLTLGTDTFLCNNQSILLSAPPATFYHWSNGSNTPQILVNTTGNYALEIIDSLGCIAADTIMITSYNPTDYQLNLVNDFSVCDVGFPLIIQTQNNNFDVYIWNNINQSTNHIVQQPGTYILNATYACGLVSDTIVIGLYPNPDINLGTDTSICIGSTLILYAGNGSQFNWSNGLNDSSIVISNPGLYGVEVTNIFGCKNNDEILVDMFEKRQQILPGDTSIANAKLITIHAYEGFNNYVWSDGDIGITNTINNEGMFYITAIDSEDCIVKDSIKITFIETEMIIPGIIQLGQPLHIINLIDGCSIHVYNLIGEQVYVNTNYKNNYIPLWSTAPYLIKLTTAEGKEFIGKTLIGI
jgi:hypothetical protein